MRRLILILCLACAPVAFTACQSSPHTQVVAVQTLKSIGQAAEATVALSAKLYADKQITAQQARACADAYDRRFQPAFRIAMMAARTDLAAPAPQELIEIAAQLAALIR